MRSRNIFGCFLCMVILIHYPSAFAQDWLPESAAQALNSPNNAILYSLDPSDRLMLHSLDPSKAPKDSRYFHWVRIIGKMNLDNKKAIEVVKIFKSAINNNTGKALLCFNPRQNLQIKYNNHVYDFLICYECHQLQIYEDDKMIKGITIGGTDKAINEILASDHIPISHIPDYKKLKQ